MARQCPQTTTFEVKGEPKQIRTEVPLLSGLTALLEEHTPLVECIYLAFTRMPGNRRCACCGVFTRMPGSRRCSSGGVYVPCIYPHAISRRCTSGGVYVPCIYSHAISRRCIYLVFTRMPLAGDVPPLVVPLVVSMYLVFTRMPLPGSRRCTLYCTSNRRCTSGGVYVPCIYPHAINRRCTSGGVYVPCIYSHAR